MRTRRHRINRLSICKNTEIDKLEEPVEHLSTSKTATTNKRVQDLNSVGCWIHLNHFLNCRIETCKYYSIVSNHLKSSNQINDYDIILVPVDRKLTSYWEGLYAIMCENFVNCHVCVKLFFHLSVQPVQCDCNSSELSDVQDYVSKLIEMYPIRGRPFNAQESAIYKLLCKELFDHVPQSQFNSALNRSIIDLKKNGDSVHGVTNKQEYEKLTVTIDHKNEQLHSRESEKQVPNVQENETVKKLECLKKHIMNGGAPIKSIKPHKAKEIKNFVSHYETWKQLQSTQKTILKIRPCTDVAFKCYFCEAKLQLSNYSKYKDVLIPDFCVKERHQTTCLQTCADGHEIPVLRQYCLSISNLYIEPPKRKEETDNKKEEIRFANVLHPDLVHMGSSNNKYIKMKPHNESKRNVIPNRRLIVFGSNILKEKFKDRIRVRHDLFKNASMETSNF